MAIGTGKAWGAVTLALLLFGCQPHSETSSATVHGNPRQIASLVPSVTELLYEIGAGDLLIAVTDNDEYPPEVETLPKVGDQTIDKEKLLSLRPDLVILDSEFNRDQAKLESLGLRVLSLKSKRLSDIPHNMRLLGRTLGRTASAESAAQQFERALQQVSKVKDPPTVFVEIWSSPMMTVGRDSLPNDLLETLGLKNVYADQVGYFQVDPEDVVRRRPEFVLLPSRGPNETSGSEKLLHRAGVTVRVIAIDGDLFTNPTPRVLQGLEIVRREVEQAQALTR